MSTGGLFNRPSTTAPLLDADEINGLISEAAVQPSANADHSPIRGSSGHLTASTSGSGTDFLEVRAYQPGDDPRRIDWRATARSRVPLVRTYHAELTRPLCLLIDRRSTMRFGTRIRLKATQAVRMALWLAGREIRTGRELSAVIMDSPVQWLPSETGFKGLMRLAKQATAPCPPVELQKDQVSTDATQWEGILTGMHHRLPQGSDLVLISDFVGLDKNNISMLHRLGRHCSVTAIRISDATEIKPSKVNGLQLSWGTNKPGISNTDASKAQTLIEEIRSWRKFIETEFNKTGIRFFDLPADQEPLADIGKLIS